MKTIILVIMLYGGTDGGRAVNTELRFGSMSVCEVAAEKLMKSIPAVNLVRTLQPTAVCIQGD